MADLENINRAFRGLNESSNLNGREQYMLTMSSSEKEVKLQRLLARGAHSVLLDIFYKEAGSHGMISSEPHRLSVDELEHLASEELDFYFQVYLPENEEDKKESKKVLKLAERILAGYVQQTLSWEEYVSIMLKEEINTEDTMLNDNMNTEYSVLEEIAKALRDRNIIEQHKLMLEEKKLEFEYRKCTPRTEDVTSLFRRESVSSQLSNALKK